MKLELFVSHFCPDCPPVVEILEDRGVKFRLRDISDSLLDLKAYLRLRDTRDDFLPVKEEMKIGIPFLVVDGKDIYFDISQRLLDKLGV